MGMISNRERWLKFVRSRQESWQGLQGEFFEPRVVERVSKMVGRIDWLMKAQSDGFYESIKTRRRANGFALSGQGGCSVEGGLTLAYQVSPGRLMGHMLELGFRDRGNDMYDRPMATRAFARRGLNFVQTIAVSHPDEPNFQISRKVREWIDDRGLVNESQKKLDSIGRTFGAEWEMGTALSSIELNLIRGEEIDLGDIDGIPLVTTQVIGAWLQVYCQAVATHRQGKISPVLTSTYFLAAETAFDRSGFAVGDEYGPNAVRLSVFDYESILSNFEVFI